MPKTILSITTSIDGFIAGPNISSQTPMGENGILLHNWLFKDMTDIDKSILKEFVDSVGVVIIGSNTYNVAIENAWGGQTPFEMPALVLTTKEPKIKVEGFTFLSNTLDKTISHAKRISNGKNIWIMGGGNVARQFLQSDLLDEIHLHLAPIILGQGIRLFPEKNTNLVRLENYNSITTKGAVHLLYRVVR